MQTPASETLAQRLDAVRVTLESQHGPDALNMPVSMLTMILGKNSFNLFLPSSLDAAITMLTAARMQPEWAELERRASQNGPSFTWMNLSDQHFAYVMRVIKEVLMEMNSRPLEFNTAIAARSEMEKAMKHFRMMTHHLEVAKNWVNIERREQINGDEQG